MSPALPREERDAIRARVEAATPGPWDWYGYGETGRTLYLDNSPYHDLNVLKTTDDWPPTDADAEFIAHARTDVPALLDALDAAEAEVVALREQYRDLATYRTTHTNLGLCPEGPDDPARDPDCPVCAALAAAAPDERETLERIAAALADSDALGCECCAVYDYDAVPDADNPRAMTLAKAVLSALAARPAPTVNAADVRAGVLAACWPNGDALDGISARTADLITASVMRHLGLTVADEGRAEA